MSNWAKIEYNLYEKVIKFRSEILLSARTYRPMEKLFVFFSGSVYTGQNGGNSFVLPGGIKRDCR